MAPFLKPMILTKKSSTTLLFSSNGDHDVLAMYQIAEIIQAIDNDIAEHYDQGKEPCNLAIELMRLQTQLLTRQGY